MRDPLDASPFSARTTKGIEMSTEINTELLESLKEMVEECCMLETSKGPALPIHEQPEYIQRAMLAIVDAEE